MHSSSAARVMLPSRAAASNERNHANIEGDIEFNTAGPRAFVPTCHVVSDHKRRRSEAPAGNPTRNVRYHKEDNRASSALFNHPGPIVGQWRSETNMGRGGGCFLC